MNSAFITALALALFVATPVNAQSSGLAASMSMDPNVSAPAYDVAKEIKVQGAIAKIEQSTTRSAAGTHIQVQTPEGAVDVHLGAGPAITAESLGLMAGQMVTVTGMMATLGGNSVLLARILTTPSRIFILRNEHGMPVRSLMPRGSAASAKPLKGGL
jgi:cell division ATPase FtsA